MATHLKEKALFAPVKGNACTITDYICGCDACKMSIFMDSSSSLRCLSVKLLQPSQSKNLVLDLYFLCGPTHSVHLVHCEGNIEACCPPEWAGGSVIFSAVYDPPESRFVCSSADFTRWCYKICRFLPVKKGRRTPASAAPQLTFGLRSLLTWMLSEMWNPSHPISDGGSSFCCRLSSVKNVVIKPGL